MRCIGGYAPRGAFCGSGAEAQVDALLDELPTALTEQERAEVAAM